MGPVADRSSSYVWSLGFSEGRSGFYYPPQTRSDPTKCVSKRAVRVVAQKEAHRPSSFFRLHVIGPPLPSPCLTTSTPPHPPLHTPYHPDRAQGE